MGWSAGIADRQDGRGERNSEKADLKDLRWGQRRENGRNGLDHRGLLALGEERALGVTRVLFEEVVDEVGGEGDQVGKKEPHNQSAQGSESPGVTALSG